MGSNPFLPNHPALSVIMALVELLLEATRRGHYLHQDGVAPGRDWRITRNNIFSPSFRFFLTHFLNFNLIAHDVICATDCKPAADVYKVTNNPIGSLASNNGTVCHDASI